MRLDDIQNAERELRSFIYYCQKLVWLYERIRALDIELSSFGISSPKIKSKEEAQYQAGTKIYSDIPLLDLISEQDEYKSEYYDLNRRCLKVQKVLVTLTDEEVELLYLRIERGHTYRQMARMLYLSKNTVSRRMNSILNKFI
ncbi:sigma factor-like helix-turn-helix DNA-binding protein [Pseudobutyrivibrio sp.]